MTQLNYKVVADIAQTQEQGAGMTMVVYVDGWMDQSERKFHPEGRVVECQDGCLIIHQPREITVIPCVHIKHVTFIEAEKVPF